ncbi:hypothetical protein ACGFX4_07375 [Kitasatospora sp. NPDC048365]|uniref:hypothetical protein n=1 Tax=Kitasatospora sp. NPDC048365 TaxID=3364050 RepID=UPI003719997D
MAAAAREVKDGGRATLVAATGSGSGSGRTLIVAGGTLAGPVDRTGLGDDPAFRPGARLRKQDGLRSDGSLTGQQLALLDALHEPATAGEPAVTATGTG